MEDVHPQRRPLIAAAWRWWFALGLEATGAALFAGCGGVPQGLGPSLQGAEVWSAQPGFDRSVVVARCEQLQCVLAVAREQVCIATSGPVGASQDLAERRRVACNLQPLRNARVTLRGENGELAMRTDADGNAPLDLMTLPVAAFPYRGGIAAVACTDCAPTALRLPEPTAALLVLARRRLDDFDAWLVVHEGAPQADAIRRARTAEVARQRALQDASALDAVNAMDRTDWVAAGRALERCRAVEVDESEGCRQAALALDERFTSGQVADGVTALESFRFEDADLALYRCALVDRRDASACAVVRGRVPLYRALAELDAAGRAWRAKDAPAALAALARCQAFDTFQPECAGMQRTIQTDLTAAALARADRLYARSRRLIQRRRLEAARALLLECLAEVPGHVRCVRAEASLQKRPLGSAGGALDALRLAPSARVRNTAPAGAPAP